jgi:hypothetical protein
MIKYVCDPISRRMGAAPIFASRIAISQGMKKNQMIAGGSVTVAISIAAILSKLFGGR